MEKNDPSIFAYIMQHIDENGFYNDVTLIDDPSPSLPRPLGTDDAYIYTAEMPSNAPGAEAVYSMLLAYASDPTLAARAVIEEALPKVLCISICDPLVDMLSTEEFPKALLTLAEDWLYTSHKRELVKYAIILLAVFGLEKLRNEHSKNLWDDLVNLCRCEEFTFFLSFAYRINNIKPQPELWELARCTKGWGKLFALSNLECSSEEDEIWLLQHGCEMDIEYPPICLFVIRKSRIMHYLSQEHLDYKTYHGCLLTIKKYLLMLNNYHIGNDDPAHIDISGIETVRMIEEVLRHAEHYATGPAELLGIIRLSSELKNLIAENDWSEIPANKNHELISKCEKLILLQNLLLSWTLIFGTDFLTILSNTPWKADFFYIC